MWYHYIRSSGKKFDEHCSSMPLLPPTPSSFLLRQWFLRQQLLNLRQLLWSPQNPEVNDNNTKHITRWCHNYSLPGSEALMWASNNSKRISVGRRTFSRTQVLHAAGLPCWAYCHCLMARAVVLLPGSRCPMAPQQVSHHAPGHCNAQVFNLMTGP